MKTPKLIFFLVLFLVAVDSARSEVDTSSAPFLELCQKQYSSEDKLTDNAYTIKILSQLAKEDDCKKLSERLKKITKIELPGFKLKSVEPVAALPQIIRLNLSRNSISDISSLSVLSGLEELVVSRNVVDSIEILAQLPNLSVLKAATNNIRDISSIKAHPKLTQVNLSDNPIADVSPLATLKLRYLSLMKVNLKGRTEFLQFQPNLETLELNSADIIDVSHVASKENKLLSKLLLEDNSIKNIEPLKNLEALKVVNLSNNPVEDISVLADLPKLRYLGISNILARGEQVESVLNQLSLVELSAVGVGLKNLDWLVNMKGSLTSLDVSDNDISDLTPLYQLNNLKKLRISSNPITQIDMKWLRSQNQLESLELDISRIKSSKDRDEIRRLMFLAFERSRL